VTCSSNSSVSGRAVNKLGAQFPSNSNLVSAANRVKGLTWYTGWLSPYLPIWTALLAPMLQVIGGGGHVGSAIMFTMITDLFSDEER
jgi:hypothetical protein